MQGRNSRVIFADSVVALAHVEIMTDRRAFGIARRSFAQRRPAAFLPDAWRLCWRKADTRCGLQLEQTIPSSLTGELPVTKGYHVGVGSASRTRFINTKTRRKTHPRRIQAIKRRPASEEKSSNSPKPHERHPDIWRSSRTPASIVTSEINSASDPLRLTPVFRHQPAACVSVASFRSRSYSLHQSYRTAPRTRPNSAFISWQASPLRHPVGSTITS